MNRKDDTDDAALSFALTGRYMEETTKEEAKAKLDLSDRKIRPSDNLHQVTDIDSVIGILTEDFPVQDNAVFEYHLINDVRYCLLSDLHIPGWLDRTTQGSTNEVGFQLRALWR